MAQMVHAMSLFCSAASRATFGLCSQREHLTWGNVTLYTTSRRWYW